MDWATDSAWTVPARWAAIMLGLCVPAANLGCGRMNSFLRDEPPMLGATTAPTSAARSIGRPEAKGPAITRTLPGRSPSNDLYSQSFGRTKPRPGGSEASNREDSGSGASPGDRDQTRDNPVLPTALSSATDSSDSLGVILKPPVPLSSATRSTAHPTPQPSDLHEPITAVPAPQPIAPPPSDPAACDPDPENETRATTVPTAETIVTAAQERLDALISYQVEINRQERVGDVLQEPEEVVLSIRRNPKAVRLEWQKGPHKGREVLFSEKETNGLMRIQMGDSPIPIPPLALPPESPLVLHNSRHPITEAGFDTIIGNLEKTIEENKAGDHSHGQISYAGQEQPEHLDHPCHKIVRVTATGETWQVFLDPESMLPVMVQGVSSSGDLLERYTFRDVQTDLPVLASADAFDPNRRWGEGKGLLNRLAGAVESNQSNTGTPR